MENIRGDSLVITSQELAGLFIDDHEAWRVGCADFFMGVVDPCAAVEIKVISQNEDGTVRGVMRPDARFLREVEAPKNICIKRPGLDGLRGRIGPSLCHVHTLLAEWAV